MHVADVRSHVTARLLARRPLPLLGRLLADTTSKGEVVPLDPDTGGEARDDRPAFILSTESEATDGHIVRQHWNLSRAQRVGIPVLWNHNADVLLGQWQSLEVRDLDGPALIGRAALDMDDEVAAQRRGQIRRGFLNAVSVGWVPGETTRRGELASDDPLYREAEDGICGPEEGLVMGSAAKPNTLVEASLVPCPAQAEASVIQRLHHAGAEDLRAAVRAPQGWDSDRLLAFLAQEPRVRAFLTAELTRIVRAELARSSAPVVEDEWATFLRRSA